MATMFYDFCLSRKSEKLKQDIVKKKGGVINTTGWKEQLHPTKIKFHKKLKWLKSHEITTDLTPSEKQTLEEHPGPMQFYKSRSKKICFSCLEVPTETAPSTC